MTTDDRSRGGGDLGSGLRSKLIVRATEGGDVHGVYRGQGERVRECLLMPRQATSTCMARGRRAGEGRGVHNVRNMHIKPAQRMFTTLWKKSVA